MKYYCCGGPWRGEFLWLQGLHTAWLNIDGQCGRYEWIAGNPDNCLDWKAKCA